MVKVYLSINNNEEVLLLPVTPAEYEVKEPWNNQEVVGLRQSINLIQNKGLATIEITSFFPIRDYPFILNRDMWGMEYVNTIERWRKRRVPVRLVITKEDETDINMPVTIDDFTYKTEKDGDIYYTLHLKEFTFVRVG
ncbi:hypothetical protein SAMN05660297_02742 [Natronincola peptidivorans]|uniref:Uncharacterized protein n=1 Tax=Natronincola peptidivorans TaxID=426128 RepID=A0A1I0FBA3_9FIRM|nr:hypothetical protein [Natronincola peptidivorans]SET55420.1 hypothetical protein SAMN05660297_02742 [Natronincola peptidivorans]